MPTAGKSGQLQEVSLATAVTLTVILLIFGMVGVCIMKRYLDQKEQEEIDQDDEYR